MRFHFPTIALASLLVIGCSGEAEVVTNHRNGMISSKGYFDSNDFKTGLWTTWDQDGRKVDTATYKKGKLDGLRTVWNENSQKMEEILYQAGNPVEAVRYEWYENGQKRSEATYKNGELDGLMTAWHANGQKAFEKNLKNGELDGLTTAWHANGQKSSKEAYKNGVEDGDFIAWHENGQKQAEGTFTNGKKDGLMTVWNENSQKMEEILYQAGNRVEEVRYEWHENGQKSSETNLKNGELDGVCIGWYENGQKQGEGTYKNGEKDGVRTMWHANGQKSSKEAYKNGVEDGDFIAWHENGQKAAWVTYKNGELDGVGILWSPNGQIISEQRYKNGKYESNGQIISEQRYKNGKKESLVKPTITLVKSPFDVVSQLEYSASELASAYNKENRNETYGDHGTILHIIAKTKTEVAYYEAVFEQEPDINVRDKDGATPLILFVTSATEPSATGVLYKFKQNQANFDIKDHSGKTALSYAIQNEDKALVQDLLNYGASANILDLQGQSELEKLLISKTEDDPIVDLLIHRDANYGKISYSSYLAIKAEKLRIDELRVAKENVVEVAPEQPPDYTKAEKRYAKADEKYIKGLNLYNIAIESARRKGGSINTTALPYLNNARKQFKIIFEAKIDPASREMRQRALGRAIHCYKIVLPLTVDSGSRRKMQKELLELQSSQ